jgi:hypothetical protein
MLLMVFGLDMVISDTNFPAIIPSKNTPKYVKWHLLAGNPAFSKEDFADYEWVVAGSGSQERT